MTAWRDARLKKALDHAPDAAPAIAPTLQAAIKRAAHAAVAPQAQRPSFWARLWPTGSAAGPWPAALASLALASLVTLLWHGQPLPDATPESSRAVAVAMAPQSSPPPSALPAANQAKADTPAAEPSPTPPRRREAVRSSAPQPAPAPPAAPPTAVADAAVPAPAAEPTVALAKAAPAPPSSEAAGASVERMARAPRVAAAPVAGAAPMALSDAALWAGWTEVRVLSGGESKAWPRSQAVGLNPRLQAVVVGLVASSDVSEGPADLVLELGRPGLRLARLVVTGNVARWTVGEGATALVRSGPVDPAALAALQAELARLDPPAR